MDNKHTKALKDYKYDKGDDIFNRIKNDKTITNQQDIINMIILWKINRRAKINSSVIEKLLHISEIKIDSLRSSENKEIEDRLKDLINSLIKIKGIRLPMASAILHFYNPETFPIIDQRAYRELYKIDAPNFTKENSCDIYLRYIKECYDYWKNNCENVGIKFSDVDKIYIN